MTLLRMWEFFSGAKLGVILISHLSWAASNFEVNTLRSPRPLQLHFPAYEPHQLANVRTLTKKQWKISCWAWQNDEHLHRKFRRMFGMSELNVCNASKKVDDLKNLNSIALVPSMPCKQIVWTLVQCTFLTHMGYINTWEQCNGM